MSFVFPRTTAPTSRSQHVQANSVSTPQVNTNNITLIKRAGSSGGNIITVQDSGTRVGVFDTLNFVGNGVTATDGGGGTVNVTVADDSTTLGDLLLADDDAGGNAITNITDLTFNSTLGIQIGTVANDGTSTSSTAIALGDDSSASGTGAIAIGTSSSSATNAIAIGRDTVAGGQSVVVGRNAFAALHDVVIGYNATRTQVSAFAQNACVCIGNESSGGAKTTVVGNYARAVGGSCVVLGYNAYGKENAVCIGANARAGNGGGMVIIGSGLTYGPTSTQTNTIVISSTSGEGEQPGYTNQQGSIVIGCTATTAGRPYSRSLRGIAIGAASDVGYTGARVAASSNDGIAIGAGAFSGSTAAVAIGYNATSSFANSVSLGSGVSTRVSNETAVQGVRMIRSELLAQTTAVTLQDFPMVDGETVAFDVFITERVTAATADENKTRLYSYRDYHASRTSATVTVNAGTTTTSSDAGWTAAAATFTIAASTTNVRVAINTVPNTDARSWVVCLHVYGGDI